MADTKISALTAATTPLAGTEVLAIVQSGVTKQVSVANLTAGRAISADSLTLTGSPLPATSGGTGQSSYAVGDLLYASTTTALSKLADVATGNALISGGVGVAPSWGKVGLTTHVSGTLPIGNGGTGQTSFTNNYIHYGSFSTSASLQFDGTNLGIGGAPSGSYKLEIIGSGRFGVSSDGVVYWGAAFTGNNRGFLTWDTNSAVIGGPQNLDVSTGGANRARFHTSGGVSIGNTTDPGATNLSVSGTVGGGITGSSTIHRFYVNNNNDWTARFVNTNSTSPYGITINYDNATPNGNQNAFWNCGDSTATRGYLQSNGGLANYSANNTNLSDRNEKTNFAPSRSFLDVICAIPVQTFNYIDQNLVDDPGLTLGVVAQDVQAVAPELVTETNWGTKENPKMRLSIYQTDLQYALMKCIQELKQQLDELRGNKP